MEAPPQGHDDVIQASLFRDDAPRWSTAQVDPPWKEAGGGRIKRGADRHYPLLSTPEIRQVLMRSGLWTPAADAHCYLWFTDNFLPDALWLLDALGFRFVRCFHWWKVKGAPAALDFQRGRATRATELASSIGIGQYARGAHESMLFGVRGDGLAVRTERRDIPSVFAAPVPRDPATGKKIHSRKPDAAYELIEARSRGPYAEFFARSRRPLWNAWGNEVPEAPAEAPA